MSFARGCSLGDARVKRNKLEGGAVNARGYIPSCAQPKTSYCARNACLAAGAYEAPERTGTSAVVLTAQILLSVCC